MDCNDIKVGDLMACETSGLHRAKVGPYIFGHVTKVTLNPINNEINFYVTWDNNNEFWYNRREIQMYKQIVDRIRNS